MISRRYFRSTFKNLPIIPAPKRWIPGRDPGVATLEQIITNKLFQGQIINAIEKKQLSECIEYYKDLFNELRNLDFAALTESELEEFLQYFGYAYSFNVLITNVIQLFTVFRLIENVDNQSKEFIQQLSYPPLEIIRKNRNLNRASSSNSTIFYCSETVDTTFMEIKPSVNSVVTLGIWKPTSSNKFLSYPIMYNISEHLKVNNTLVSEFINGYFNVLNREYSKSILNKNEYLVSSFFSERIFEIDDSEWNVDCILYPSVGHNFMRKNFAFKPGVVDSRLYLSNAYEFRVREIHYDQTIINFIPTRIAVAKVELLKKLHKVTKDGRLEWISTQ